MIAAVAALGALGIVLGALLGWAAVRLRRDGSPLADAIDKVLPQTQCAQCGYPGCRPYAEAIARGEADINQCPPGGEAGIRALATLLGREPKPLNTEHGTPKPKALAWIDEAACIGCAKCILACPVDAIIGAPKFMHTVLEAECTGCELCIAPCPVDCIHMRPAHAGIAAWRPQRPVPARPPQAATGP
jgi:electron transport complex protein RnfB